MNPREDWARWGTQWQQQPTVDANWLSRQVRRKHWGMRAIVGIELIVSIVAASQIIRLLWLPGAELRWKLWSVLALLFVLILQYLYFHMRRGTWRASAGSPRELLQLTARRAHAGIRLARLNIGSTILLVVITLLVATPELLPSRWQHDSKMKLILLLQFGVNGLIVAVTLGFCVWYIRRQRRLLQQINALLFDDVD